MRNDRKTRLGSDHKVGRARATMIAFFAVLMVVLGCERTLAASPRVILLRGWFGIFSTGLDALAEQLRGHGIEAEVAGHLSWSNEVAAVLRDRSAGRAGSLILVGHSQGANNAIDMARALAPSHVNVQLLVTLSPFLQNRVPPNVMKAINYYQAPGWGQAIEAEPGFQGKLVNINLAGDPTISHIGIDKSAKIQAAILQEITAVR